MADAFNAQLRSAAGRRSFGTARASAPRPQQPFDLMDFMGRGAAAGWAAMHPAPAPPSRVTDFARDKYAKMKKDAAAREKARRNKNRPQPAPPVSTADALLASALSAYPSRAPGVPFPALQRPGAGSAPPGYSVPDLKFGKLPVWKDMPMEKGFEAKIKSIYGPAARMIAQQSASAGAARDAYSQDLERYQQWLSGENAASSARLSQGMQAAATAASEARTSADQTQAGANALSASTTGTNADVAAASGQAATQANQGVAARNNQLLVDEIARDQKLVEREQTERTNSNNLRVGDLRRDAQREYNKMISELAARGVELKAEEADKLYQEAVRVAQANREIKQANFSNRMSLSERADSRSSMTNDAAHRKWAAQQQAWKDREDLKDRRRVENNEMTMAQYQARVSERDKNLELRMQRAQSAASLANVYAKNQGQGGMTPQNRKDLSKALRQEFNAWRTTTRGPGVAASQGPASEEYQQDLANYIGSIATMFPNMTQEDVMTAVAQAVGKGNLASVLRKNGPVVEAIRWTFPQGG